MRNDHITHEGSGRPVLSPKGEQALADLRGELLDRKELLLESLGHFADDGVALAQAYRTGDAIEALRLIRANVEAYAADLIEEREFHTHGDTFDAIRELLRIYD